MRERILLNELKAKKLCRYFLIASIFCLFTLACNKKPKKQTDEVTMEQSTTQDRGTPSAPDTTKAVAPTVKVFLENSGSMDGYVKGVTNFENAIYSYLSNIQLANLGRKDSLKNVMILNYINSIIIPFQSDQTLEDFVKELEPVTFRQRGGNRGESDISDILELILENHLDNEISIMISDCIFSPGKKYKRKDNAEEYLVAQQIGIKNSFVKKIYEMPNFAIVALRLTSQFNGLFYNKFDDPINLEKAHRPFFIWLMGGRDQLKKLMAEVNIKNIKGAEVEHMYTASEMPKEVNYGFLMSKSIGRFSIDKQDPKKTILKARPLKKHNRNQFQIAVGVDFSKHLLNDEYLLDPNNYRVSNNSYLIQVEKNEKESFSPYTHIIKLISNRDFISKGQVKVTLIHQGIPRWVDEYTDYEGNNIFEDDAMEKTFGLKHLIEGVEEAYYYKNIYNTITININ